MESVLYQVEAVEEVNAGHTYTSRTGTEKSRGLRNGLPDPAVPSTLSKTGLHHRVPRAIELSSVYTPRLFECSVPTLCVYQRPILG